MKKNNLLWHQKKKFFFDGVKVGLLTGSGIQRRELVLCTVYCVPPNPYVAILTPSVNVMRRGLGR